MTDVDYVMTLDSEDVGFIDRFERRTGIDIRDWLFEALRDDYEGVVPCLWYDYSEDTCKGCAFSESCPDKKRGAP